MRGVAFMGIMKKKMMTIVISIMLCAALFAGCGRAEEKKLTGTIDEIKDLLARTFKLERNFRIFMEF